MFNIFEKWKIVAEQPYSFAYGGGIFNRDHWDEIPATIVYYEKPSGKRKVEIIGMTDRHDNKQAMKLIEPVVYKWRDNSGQLPSGAIKV